MDDREPRLPLTPDDPIFWAEEFIDLDTLEAFYKREGVRCFMCCAAEQETFREGAEVHKSGPHGQFDPDDIVVKLNKLAKKYPRDKSSEPRIGLLSMVLDLIFPKKPKVPDLDDI